MSPEPASYRGDDELLFGIILGVLAVWLFAQTTLNIAPAMAADLAVATNVMKIAAPGGSPRAGHSGRGESDQMAQGHSRAPGAW